MKTWKVEAAIIAYPVQGYAEAGRYKFEHHGRERWNQGQGRFTYL